jgi:hypothetical protein
MSRHFLPGCCRAVARRAPRGYRSAPSGLKGLRPLRGGLAAALDPGDLWRTGPGSRTGRPKGLPGNAAAPAGAQAQGEGGNEQIPGTQNKEGTPVNSCSITSTSENYKIILWLASG